MSIFKALISLAIALPEIIRLIDNLNKSADKEAKAMRVKEDLQKINKAFEDENNEALNKIFNS